MGDSRFSENNGLYFMAVNLYSSPIAKTTCTGKCEPPGPWSECRHPGGTLYYCRETPRALTRANLSSPALRESIEDALDLIRSKEHAYGLPLPSDIELVLEQIDSITWGYYYANNETRTVFWLEGTQGGSPFHITPKIHVQYWEHWYQFPNMRDVTQDIIKELRGMALYASAEYIMSPSFKHLLSPQELEKILNMLGHIEKPDLNPSNHLAAVVGRFMKEFATQQFFDCRRERTPPIRSSSLLRFLSPLLLYTPNYMFKELDRRITDMRVNNNDWLNFVDKCRFQWRELTLNATVFLTANIAFLAIPLVSSGRALNSSVAQVASYISVIASIGTLIAAPILITRETYTAAPRLTLRKAQLIAVVYALPHGFLLWSLLSFLIAFLAMALTGTSAVTQISVSLACLMVFTPIVLSVIWSIWFRE